MRSAPCRPPRLPVLLLAFSAADKEAHSRRALRARSADPVVPMTADENQRHHHEKKDAMQCFMRISFPSLKKSTPQRLSRSGTLPNSAHVSAYLSNRLIRCKRLRSRSDRKPADEILKKNSKRDAEQQVGVCIEAQREAKTHIDGHEQPHSSIRRTGLLSGRSPPVCPIEGWLKSHVMRNQGIPDNKLSGFRCSRRIGPREIYPSGT